jgi:hypothetical protein
MFLKFSSLRSDRIIISEESLPRFDFLFQHEIGTNVSRIPSQLMGVFSGYCDQWIPVDFTISEVPIKGFPPHLDEFLWIHGFTKLRQMNIFIFEEGMKEYSQSDNYEITRSSYICRAV